MMNLRPAAAAPMPCKICGQPAALCGVVDFNRPCQIDGGAKLPLVGVPVYYRRCGGCGFLFTDAFDDWGHAEFRQHIYNDDYAAVDPDYREARPRANASLVQKLFDSAKADIRVLDYGGGNDVLCAALRSAGFAAAVTYDPFVPEHAHAPEGTFNLVTCFETLEHMPDPLAGMRDIVARLAEPGLVLFSTLRQPADFEKLGVNWWYVGPRNGHISMFSGSALAKAWGQHGCKVLSFNDVLHVAFRTLPEFARRLLK